MMDCKRNQGSSVQTSKYLPLEMTSLTPEIVRKAETELGETPEAKKEALKELKKLINAEKDFMPLMDDVFLLRFLRTKKFNPENAFKTLKNYYTFKARYSRTLTEFRPSELQNVLDFKMIRVMPFREESGCLVGCAKISTFNLDKASIDELFATVLLGAEYYLRSEITQICGVVVVIDLKGLSLRLVRHIASPTLLYRIVRAIQDCLPLRIKGIHFIHEPFYFSVVFNILKNILSEKIRNRFQFHGNNLASLHKQVPPAVLPQEMGGELGPIDNTELANALLDNEAYFVKLFKYGFQEKRAQFIRKRSSMAFGLFV